MDNKRLRRTKILATLGPASDNEETLRQMIRAGLNAVRCNFSHGSEQDHQERIERIRKVAEEESAVVGIVADLQGPKIRVARFKQGKINLENGAEFILDAQMDIEAGDEKGVGIDYKELPQDVAPGDFFSFFGTKKTVVF